MLWPLFLLMVVQNQIFPQFSNLRWFFDLVRSTGGGFLKKIFIATVLTRPQIAPQINSDLYNYLCAIDSAIANKDDYLNLLFIKCVVQYIRLFSGQGRGQHENVNTSFAHPLLMLLPLSRAPSIVDFSCSASASVFIRPCHSHRVVAKNTTPIVASRTWTKYKGWMWTLTRGDTVTEIIIALVANAECKRGIKLREK